MSLDSEGYPLSLRSPPKPLVKGKGNEKEATELQQPSFKRKRKGSFGAKPAPEEEHSSLKTALGIGPAMKKPCAKKIKKKKKPLLKGPPLLKGSAAASSAASGREKWVKIWVVKPNKPPWRAYIQAQRSTDEKSFSLWRQDSKGTPNTRRSSRRSRRRWKASTSQSRRFWQ